MSAAGIGRPVNNLAGCFQEVLTATLRLRSQPQMIASTETMRTQLRQLLQGAMGDARTLGYSNQHVQMAVLVAVAFLDETVLNLQTPASAEWSRRPLQEELFGGHMAGETVFQNLQTVLQGDDAPEIADVAELHCLCLELGYKGRYAFSGGGELHQIIEMCRRKIHRIRGERPMFAAPVVAAPQQRAKADGVARALLITAIAMAVLTIAGFAGYEYSLSSQASHLVDQSTSLQ